MVWSICSGASTSSPDRVFFCFFLFYVARSRFTVSSPILIGRKKKAVEIEIFSLKKKKNQRPNLDQIRRLATARPDSH